ncbi:patatin-like phospholipase family protein [Pseudomonas sp. S1(2024)]|uniref:patatin-like phospholipase family protein n=1 Tax=Pseudomonas sp. S1(2024) TaxID=3390191 RepID=UPI003978133C
MSNSLHEIKVKRQEAFAVFLRERQIHEMARLISDGWVAFLRVGSYVFTPEQMKNQDPEEVKPYLLGILTRVMHSDQADDERFFAVADPHGRDNRHLFKDLERGLAKIDPALKKKLGVLKNHIADTNRVITKGMAADASATDRRKAELILQQKENILESACDRAVNMRKKQDIVFAPKAVIFQGGGAKKMGASGVAEYLEQIGALKDIKYVGGTSAGALIGLMMAFGFPAKEIKHLVHYGRFAQFFAESALPISMAAKYQRQFTETVKTIAARVRGKRYLRSISTETSPQTEGIMLKDFSREYMVPMLVEHTGITTNQWLKMDEEVIHTHLQRLEGVAARGEVSLAEIYHQARRQFLSDMHAQGLRAEAETLQFVGLFGRSEAYQGAIQCLRFAKSRLDPESETIEEFIGDVIQSRLDRLNPHALESITPPLNTRKARRNVTFAQLKQLADLFPQEGFKEFGVAMTDHHLPISPRAVRRFCARLVQRTITAFTEGKKVDDGFGALDNRLFFKPIFARAANKDGRFGEHQHMPIKKAVRASMNLPVVFKVMKFNGMNLIDGGVNNNLPLRMFTDQFASQQEADAQTIAFIQSSTESDLEYQAVDELINNKGSKLRIMLDEEIQRQMYQFDLNALGLPRIGSLRRHWDAIKIHMLRAVSATVGQFMSHHNPQVTSEEALNNIGILRTGTIDTADFHIPVEVRQQLHEAGVRAARNLMSAHPDRHLRFALCRLRSLSQRESELSRQLGLPSFDVGVLDKAIQQADLDEVMNNPMLDAYSLGEILQGRL